MMRLLNVDGRSATFTYTPDDKIDVIIYAKSSEDYLRIRFKGRGHKHRLQNTKETQQVSHIYGINYPSNNCWYNQYVIVNGGHENMEFTAVSSTGINQGVFRETCRKSVGTDSASPF